MSNASAMTGMVLSSQPIGEYDRRIVLLTRENGKIACFAKGCRKPTSHLLSASRSFAFGTFYLYEGRSSYNLQKAEIKNFFEDISTDYEKAIYACFFAEIADYYGKEGLDAKDAINLLYASFLALIDERIDNKIVKAAYEIRAIADAGECPPLESLFSKPDNLSAGAIDAFNYSLTASLDKVFKFTLNEQSLKDFSTIGNSIVKYAIDKKIKSQDFIEGL